MRDSLEHDAMGVNIERLRSFARLISVAPRPTNKRTPSNDRVDLDHGLQSVHLDERRRRFDGALAAHMASPVQNFCSAPVSHRVARRRTTGQMARSGKFVQVSIFVASVVAIASTTKSPPRINRGGLKLFLK